MARFQNEEACLVLLTVLERLASDPASFIHGVAIKGGILMAGELHSPRASADIDATSGVQKRIDAEIVVREIRRAGREFNVRQDREPERTPGGSIVHLRFDSLTDAGTAKVEVSVREDLVFAVRDAVFNLADLGLAPFSIPALAEVELVSEKLRALVQRAQPRDLFDLRLYLIDSR
jgi:predicted nucleotidyltransferase component of viral defense system